ncbi:hypothetical protein DFH06DRAFT_1210358, partial [Mycena polygramma]
MSSLLDSTRPPSLPTSYQRTTGIHIARVERGVSVSRARSSAVSIAGGGGVCGVGAARAERREGAITHAAATSPAQPVLTGGGGPCDVHGRWTCSTAGGSDTRAASPSIAAAAACVRRGNSREGYRAAADAPFLSRPVRRPTRAPTQRGRRERRRVRGRRIEEAKSAGDRSPLLASGGVLRIIALGSAGTAMRDRSERGGCVWSEWAWEESSLQWDYRASNGAAHGGRHESRAGKVTTVARAAMQSREMKGPGWAWRKETQLVGWRERRAQRRMEDVVKRAVRRTWHPWLCRIRRSIQTGHKRRDRAGF